MRSTKTAFKAIPILATLALSCGGEPARPSGTPASSSAAPSVAAKPLPKPRVVRVYHNGKIYTAVAAERYVEAFAVSDGKILRAGKAEALFKEFPDATRVDLHKRTVVPGFNDAHFHSNAFPAGARLFKAEPPLDPSKAELRAAIVAEVAKNPGKWIIADVGSTAAEDPSVNREFLDAIAGANPVFVRTWYGHGQVFNSKALAALGIADGIADPPGGKFGRTKAGLLDGRVSEYAEWVTGRAVMKLATDGELGAGQGEEFGTALHFGITSLQTMSWSPADRYLKLAAANFHAPRVRWINWPLAGEAVLPLQKSVDGSNVSVSGIKWILDGTPFEHGAALAAPYSDDAKSSGHLNFTRDEVDHFFQIARKEKQQILFHAVGAAAIEEALLTAENVPTDERARIRPRIEHGDQLRPDQDEQVKRLSFVVVQNPTHFGSVEMLIRRFGPERRAMRLASLVHAGVHVAIGSDGAVNPFVNIMLAVTHPFRPTEALTREEAVDAYTRESAYAELAEAERGTIEAGKLADFAVLSQDIFTCPVPALPGTFSVLTVVGGKALSGAESDL